MRWAYRPGLESMFPYLEKKMILYNMVCPQRVGPTLRGIEGQAVDRRPADNVVRRRTRVVRFT